VIIPIKIDKYAFDGLEELKEQIDRKLVVSRTDKGSRAVWTE